jgi:branched-chain amino acid transport system substrate-binding protein
MPSFLRTGALAFIFQLMLAGTALAADPIKIGFVCPFSGGSQDFGLSARMGADLAVEEINAAGGYLGRPLQLVFKDDEAKPDNAPRIADELINKDKVAFTIGFCNTGVAAKAIDVFQSAKHLLMVPVSTGTVLTSKFPAKDSYVFRMSARDAIQAPFIVQDLRKRGFTKIAIFADKTGYGEGGFKDVSAALAKDNLQPVYVARFDLGVKDLTAEMREAKEAGVQAIVSYTVGPESAVVAKSRAQAGVTAPLVGAWPMSFRTVWEGAGAAANGVMMVQTFIEDAGNSRRNGFILALNRKLAGKPAGSLMAAAQSYDAVLLMFNAMFQTNGDLSSAALKSALENLKRTYYGVVAVHDKPFSTDSKDAFASSMIWMGKWNNGRIDFAYAEDAKRSAIARKKAD